MSSFPDEEVDRLLDEHAEDLVWADQQPQHHRSSPSRPRPGNTIKSHARQDTSSSARALPHQQQRDRNDAGSVTQPAVLSDRTRERKRTEPGGPQRPSQVTSASTITSLVSQPRLTFDQVEDIEDVVDADLTQVDDADTDVTSLSTNGQPRAPVSTPSRIPPSTFYGSAAAAASSSSSSSASRATTTPSKLVPSSSKPAPAHLNQPTQRVSVAPPRVSTTSSTALRMLEQSVAMPDELERPPTKRLRLERPAAGSDQWDFAHVRLPCSSRNVTRVNDADVSKWQQICQRLDRPMRSAADIQDVILFINPRFAGRWDFSGLRDFLERVLGADEQSHFFDHTLPGLVQLALALPDRCACAIPLLKKQLDTTIMLSQAQIACLLANSFLCTYPRRNPAPANATDEYRDYPSINFSELFRAQSGSAQTPCAAKQAAKFRCLFNYFDRAIEFSRLPREEQEKQSGNVTFRRQVLQPHDSPDWGTTATLLRPLRLSKGAIEDAVGMLQTDFANRRIGGGVLGRGAVQEEIRFMISPELIVARLFTAELDDNEALIVVGAERYNLHRGYGDTFEFVSDYRDTTPRDRLQRRRVYLACIDALMCQHLPHKSDQYAPQHVQRELCKAYCGFVDRFETDPTAVRPVATGFWGGGVFGGSRQLKCLLQLMAASEARRDVWFFPYDDPAFEPACRQLSSLLQRMRLTVSQLFSSLLAYHQHLNREPAPPTSDSSAAAAVSSSSGASSLLPSDVSLFDFLMRWLPENFEQRDDAE